MQPFCDLTGELQCAICQEQGSCKEWLTLRCGHALHSSCAADWFRTGHDECPLCRDSPRASARAGAAQDENEEQVRHMLRDAGVPASTLSVSILPVFWGDPQHRTHAHRVFHVRGRAALATACWLWNRSLRLVSRVMIISPLDEKNPDHSRAHTPAVPSSCARGRLDFP